MTAKIPVEPKLIYTSKSFLGAVITAASIILPSLAQQTWISPEMAKLLTNAGGMCGTALMIIGSIDRPELFFRPGKLQDKVQEAANVAMTELTIKELAQSGQQALAAIQAPADQKTDKFVELFVDFQRRLSDQDQVLAEIKAATTTNQMPAYSDYPDRTDLPSEPRPEGQHVDRGTMYRVPPAVPGEQMAVSHEPDVLAANSEGVWDNY